MGRPKTSWRIERVALRAILAGATQREAVVVAGVSVNTVGRMVADHGGVTPRQTTARANVLTIDEREEILVGLERNESYAVIGGRLGRARCTVWREVTANGGRCRYRAYAAEARVDDRARRPRPCWFETRPWLWDQVRELLGQWWSPEQISLWLHREYPDEPEWWVSHESIYQAIFVQARGQCAGLAAHPSDQLGQHQGHHELALLVGEVGQGDDGGTGLVAVAVEQPPDVERRTLPPCRERGRRHQAVELGGQLLAALGREDIVEIEHPELAQRWLLDLADE